MLLWLLSATGNASTSFHNQGLHFRKHNYTLSKLPTVNSDFDYQEDKDNLPRPVVIWIIIISIASALVLSQVMI
jgi:hypothetical protein